MYVFDDSRRPLLVVQLRGRVSLPELERFKADLDDLLARRQSYGLVYDFSEAEIPPREVIMDIVKWTRRIRLESREHFEHVAEPIPAYTAYFMSPRLAKLLRFVEQMTPRTEVPKGIFDSLEDAVAAAEQALWSYGVEVPSPLRSASG